jgi:hypothetical protein
MKRAFRKPRASGLVILCIVLLQAVSLCGAKGSGEDDRRGIEVNSPTEEKRLLIAAGPEDGCELILSSTIDHIKAEPVYIRVTDQSDLISLTDQHWDAVVVIHLYRKGQPPQAVKEHVQREKDFSRLLVIPYQHIDKEFDATTAASLNTELQALIEANLKRLRALLEL